MNIWPYRLRNTGGTGEALTSPVPAFVYSPWFDYFDQHVMIPRPAAGCPLSCC